MNRAIRVVLCGPAIAMLLIGCPAPVKDGHVMVGFMQINGHYAYLNGNLVTGYVRVFDGDKVATGPATSIKVVLRRGGYIQFDENTDDPSFIQEAKCLLLKLFHGQVFIDAHGVCVEDPNLRVALNSQVNLRTIPPATKKPSPNKAADTADVVSILTVVEGNVVVRRPTANALGPNQQYFVGPGKIQILPLSPQQTSATVAWTQRYFPLPPPPLPEPAPSPHAAPPSPSPVTPAPSRPPTPQQEFVGWCCDTRLSVSRTTRAQCVSLPGTFFTTEQAANNSCRVL